MFSKIKIAAIGKTIKELEAIEHHYLKQIKTKIDLDLLKNSSNLPIAERIKKESASLLKATNGTSYIIVLDIDGESYSSDKLALKLNLISKDYKSIAFIIGGSDGLSLELKQKADLIISISKLTLPHQLARIILLEQLYRSEQILNNSLYHK